MDRNSQPLKSGMGMRQSSDFNPSYDEMRIKSGMDPQRYSQSDRYGSSMEPKMGSYSQVPSNGMAHRHSLGSSQMRNYEYPRPPGYGASGSPGYDGLPRGQQDRYGNSSMSVRPNYDYQKVSQNRMMNGAQMSRDEGYPFHLDKDANMQGKIFQSVS